MLPQGTDGLIEFKFVLMNTELTNAKQAVWEGGRTNHKIDLNNFVE